MSARSDTSGLDLTSAAGTFPCLNEPIVDRSNFIATVERLFEATSVVVVEGSEGDGRTTFLAQFAQATRDAAVSVFLSPFSHWSYRPEFVAGELLNQLSILVDVVVDPVAPSSVLGAYRDALFRIQRKQRRAPLYFVVDGLDEGPNGGPEGGRGLLDVLPLGLPGFRFLLSAHSMSRLGLDSRVGARGFPLPPFSVGETRAFLAGFALTDQELQEIQALSRGMRGRLATIRRILGSGSRPRILRVSGQGTCANSIRWSGRRQMMEMRVTHWRSQWSPPSLNQCRSDT